uniref:Uncharacterized protein n=1 Tax=Chromera velia CCMP2878 TaxID=1169474 RepID=A0A0G4HLG6_9ALVE|eukprot:Cvel_7350.t1-p1 / transcript=Cvel_7350.t1 / gene=Cvel_7350 / organism=Chromera_velia_CCMP2878 / gene_product=hypothetical protein / transcript_product=hypothetical protein / location=Cvel_scaffold381:62062-62286(+) / protein_length=75 / sequence_SO=supercontig / SO=protein_coding / is_pseudo=false
MGALNISASTVVGVLFASTAASAANVENAGVVAFASMVFDGHCAETVEVVPFAYTVAYAPSAGTAGVAASVNTGA